MSTAVVLPALGESVTEGTVTRWLKNIGDRVEVDEGIVEISTDKVDTEIPSPIAGILEEILVAEDETVEVGALLARIGEVAGRAFNLGGGPGNAVSLRQVLDEIALITGAPARTGFEPWRQGDQLYFVADTGRLQQATGWRAETGWRDGLWHLAGWLRANRGLGAAAPERPALRRLA
jgi:pyruvate/2-oxoglutarate dehydrogenase complex dihydrolipoamide acyltransferase (E2) component